MSNVQQKNNVSNLLNWDMLEELLCCPSCSAEDLRYDTKTKVLCGECAQEYPVRNGIIDFMASVTLPEPAFYQNTLFQTFISNLAAIHKAHYESRFSGGIEDRMKDDLFRLVKAGEGPSIDLGCGAGDGVEFIGESKDIIGVDAQMSLLETARDRYPDMTLIRANLANLPFRTGVLNRVFSNAVLEHVFYLEQTMGHIQRCLAPNGQFYVGVPTEGGLAVAVARLYTSNRNAKILGLTPKQSRAAQRMDHCNTIFLIENVIKKHFTINQTSLWPFQFGAEHINLFKSYSLSHLDISPEPPVNKMEGDHDQ